MNDPDVDVDVLVVGLGPVGATLAALLARRSISVFAIDRDAQVYPLPRAVGFDHEVMRIFQGLGIAEGVVANSRFSLSYEFVNADGEILLNYDRTRTPRPSGWPSHATFYQPAVEKMLRELIGQSPAASMRISTKLVSIAQHPGHVEALCEGPEGRFTVRARLVVGCDGASSRVRSEIGAKLRDLGFDEPWLVVDFLSDNEDGLPRTNLQFCDPARPATFMKMGPGRHRWEIMMLEGETVEQALDPSFTLGFLRRHGFDVGAEIERKAVYRFHALIADRWRVGRVLLAGDSAHQTPPFAGQGMCSGLRDADNLAWKIEAVLRRGADEALLDTYQTEREPHVEGIIRAAVALGKVVCTTDPVVAAERDARMIADRRAGVQPISMAYPPLSQGCLFAGSAGAGEYFPQPWAEADGVTLRFDDLYTDRALLLLRGHGGRVAFRDPDALVVMALADPAVDSFAAALAAWLDERGAEAVLVRPDRYVFGTGSPQALADAYGELTRVSRRAA